jgi:hypothetical protein
VVVAVVVVAGVYCALGNSCRQMLCLMGFW